VKYNYPVIILVEDNFKDEYIDRINNNIHFNVIFENIKFKTYDELNNKNIESVLITHNGIHKWPLGYRHMCRFWTGDFLNKSVMNKYKYIWRMDSDAYITSEINYDLFTYMETNNIVYNYSNITHDEEEVCVGLYHFSENFFKKRNMNFHWDIYNMFTTHVEIINVEELLNNALYLEYYNEIDETDNFYLYRWGDAPIRFITLTNLNLKCEPMNISYYHGNDGEGRREQLLDESTTII